MPVPFQPRFVDLVRNFSTTTGTGNFVLGAAVNGFNSFSPAVLPGESFYYSAIGVDKPAEREVGRGTMQANGTIAREPIAGPLTNFTPGAKSIALIAAAEWFSAVQAAAGSSGGGSGAASRAALAALLSQLLPVVLAEAGREGIFVFSSANLSAQVTADLNQGIYVAPLAAPTGASGAWVRKFSGPVNVKWFGAVGDNVANDGPAFLAAIDYLKSTRIAGFGYGSGSGDLFVPAGRYYLGTTTLDLSHTMRIRGEGTGLTGGGSSVLRWAAGNTGIRVQAYNTTGASGVWSPPDNVAGSGSSIERLFLQGGYVSPTEGEYHGIHLRGMALIREVYVSGFEGDGIHAAAAIGSGGAGEGNDNLSRIENVVVERCRVGIYFDSADANACNIVAANVSGNRTWGIWDSSFLGNTYTGCHSASNGWDGALGSIPTACTYLGNRYFVKPGQAAAASTNAPSGTTADNAYWNYIGAGGTYNGIVAWVSGTTFREGGCYYVDDNNNSRNIFVGCYAEGDQNPAQIWSNTSVVIGGLFGGTTLHGSAVYVRGASGGQIFDNGNFLGNVDVDGTLNVDGQATFGVRAFANAGLTNSGGQFISNSPNASMGPTAGAAADFGLELYSTNVLANINFTSWAAGVPSLDASIFGWRGNGLVLNGQGGSVILRTASVARSRQTASEFRPENDNDQDLGLAAQRWKTIYGVAGNFSGAITASNLSGTNTGDQTITLTGNVTGSGTGSFATTIAAGAVTYAKIQNVSANSKLLGRATAGAGVVEELGLAGGLTISGSNLTLGALTPTSVAATGALTTSSPTAGNGYATGAGGAATQATSKSTAVTLNTVCGAITMSAAALATVTNVTFTLTNSAIAATDVVVVAIKSGAATAGTYQAWFTATAAGSCTITVRNISAGSLSEALVLNFAVNKAVAA